MCPTFVIYTAISNGRQGSWISISGLFNVLGIKMLIKILWDEIYFGGMADVNYEKGGLKLSRCLH